jgi:hypothetical protein
MRSLAADLQQADAHRPSDRPADGWRRRWLPFVAVAVVFAIAVLYEIDLPGVYSDEVNPDYHAVRVLNWNGPRIASDALPGTTLFDRIPVLTGLHHGTQTLWLGLPAFWFFGTSVEGLRITHGLFALGILASLYALLCAGGIARWWAAAGCAALAIDPAFVYAFRTQGYLSLAPSAWMFLSLYALLRQRTAPAERRRRWLLGSGVLMGLAFSGYFLYLFYAPAIALAVIALAEPHRSAAERVQRLALWACGFCVGALPYVIGYAMVIHSQGSLAAGWAYIVDAQSQAGGRATGLALGERIDFLAMMIGLVFSNASHHWLMFGEPTPAVGAPLKLVLLLALPAMLWAFAEYRKRATALLRILLGMQLCFAAWALYFGGRLWAHHYEPLVPIAYAALAIGLAALVTGSPPPWLRATYMTTFALLLALNAAGDAGEAEALRRTGGVGLYSDAINRFADDVLRDHTNDYVLMPDWGLFTSAVFLTEGTVEMDMYENPAYARSVLCAGRDVTIALINGDRAARLSEWQGRLAWGTPAIVDYRQRDGTVVFSIGTFKGSEAGERCAASPASAQPAGR